MKGPTTWQRLERKISFLCLFVYLFFLPSAFLVFFFLLTFFVIRIFFHPHFSIRIFPSASAIRRYPVRVLQTPLGYMFYGGNVVRVLVQLFFSLPAHFHLALVATGISDFVTVATKFSCCSSNKKNVSSVFISRSRPLLPFFSLSFAGLPPTFSFSVFLLLYIPNLLQQKEKKLVHYVVMEKKG